MAGRRLVANARHVLGMRVDDPGFAGAVEAIVGRAQSHPRGYVCVANVHMTMTAFDDAGFQAVVNDADLVTPDGMPLVWALRLLGRRQAERVRGPDLMPAVLAEAARLDLPVGFYGATPDTLERVAALFRQRHPQLRLDYSYAPPFRPLDAVEDAAVTADIVASGVRILFVGLGCPKQERWMAAHRGRLPAVLIGVGAAFDMHAGNVSQAPLFMQRAGLEWLHRLASEPRRLWRRYLVYNSRFVWHFVRSWFRADPRPPAPPPA